MKRRKKISIVICIVFLVISLLVWNFIRLVYTSGHPGINSQSFAPAKVLSVPDEQDISVNVFPAIDMMIHGYPEEMHEINLNSIRKGWLVEQYGENCRLLFEVNDADMEDFFHFSEKQHYYYAEIIPRDRLKITDITARQGQALEDPFSQDTMPRYASCCINVEIRRYDFLRSKLLVLILVNVIFVFVVVTFNLVISKVARRRT